MDDVALALSQGQVYRETDWSSLRTALKYVPISPVDLSLSRATRSDGRTGAESETAPKGRLTYASKNFVQASSALAFSLRWLGLGLLRCGFLFHDKSFRRTVETTPTSNRR
jgi:hypothetical protein